MFFPRKIIYVREAADGSHHIALLCTSPTLDAPCLHRLDATCKGANHGKGGWGGGGRRAVSEVFPTKRTQKAKKKKKKLSSRTGTLKH